MRNALKSKSLVSNKTDGDIENGCFTTQFISFESCIELFKEKYKNNQFDLSETIVGYRVTKQGIEILK